MKRLGLFVIVGIAASMAVGPVRAGGGDARLSFVGAVVTEGCNSSQPLLGAQGAVGGCGVTPSARAVYQEHTGQASDRSGIAMLDYFADRAGGGRKMVVTRQYL